MQVLWTISRRILHFICYFFLKRIRCWIFRFLCRNILFNLFGIISSSFLYTFRNKYFFSYLNKSYCSSTYPSKRKVQHNCHQHNLGSRHPCSQLWTKLVNSSIKRHLCILNVDQLGWSCIQIWQDKYQHDPWHLSTQYLHLTHNFLCKASQTSIFNTRLKGYCISSSNNIWLSLLMLPLIIRMQ